MTLVSALGALLAGCGGDQAPAAAPATAKPASVTAPVKEAQLTTVTLTPEAEKRLAVVTAPVERRTVARTRTLGGEIVTPSGQSLVITAPVAGTLQAPPAVPIAGSEVSRGQMLFRLVPIQPSERDAAVDAQQAAATAAARRDALALKVQRAERLVTDGAGSRRALEEAQAELAVAEADLKAARDRIALATRSGTSQGDVVLESPETGIVQDIHVREGQAVAAGARLLDLVRLAMVWVRVPVYAGEATGIDSSAPAQVLLLGEAADAEGALARPIPAPPSANATTAGVDLYYAMANPNQRFRPGERVAVRLARRETEMGLVVPKAALLHDAYGGTWVYVVREPRVYSRQRVVVSDVSGPLAVLSQGPVEGLRVVTDGAAELFGVEFGSGK
ncbi:MAG TPA: efflux RND transporter periplasmic adaptor subunit [Vicinamibacterales bacterium]